MKKPSEIITKKFKEYLQSNMPADAAFRRALLEYLDDKNELELKNKKEIK